MIEINGCVFSKNPKGMDVYFDMKKDVNPLFADKKDWVFMQITYNLSIVLWKRKLLKKM